MKIHILNCGFIRIHEDLLYGGGNIKTDFHSNLSPFVISRSPSVTISTVLALVMYLLYLFGMIFPNIPKMIINRHVPRPNANIDIFCRLRTAPWLHLVLHLKQGTPCGRRVLLSFQLIERFTILVIVVFEPLIIHQKALESLDSKAFLFPLPTCRRAIITYVSLLIILIR